MVVSLNGAAGHLAVLPVATVSNLGQGHVQTQHRKATELTAQEILLNPSLAGSPLVQVMSLRRHIVAILKMMKNMMVTKVKT